VNKRVFNSLRKLSLLTLDRISEIVRQWVPGRRASNRESPSVSHTFATGVAEEPGLSRQLADRRRYREATSETGWQRSTKYCGVIDLADIRTTVYRGLLFVCVCAMVKYNIEAIFSSYQGAILLNTPLHVHGSNLPSVFRWQQCTLNIFVDFLRMMSVSLT